jgi:hypothetical protein
MTTPAFSSRLGGDTKVARPALQHMRWLTGGLALGFLVPFVLADRLAIPRDLYYGIYAAVVTAFFALWARSTGQSIAPLVRRRFALAVALGVLFALLLAAMVVRVDEPTARPGGIELIGAVLWRGVLYGATDGLLLSAFPILVVFAAFAGSAVREWFAGRMLVVMTALLASLAMTAAYHLGYGDFRSGKVRSPIAGDVAWSVPTLATLNPIGAPIAHIGVHVAAVLHSYETELFLPPHA